MRKKIAVALVFVLLTTVLFPFQALAAYDKELEKAIGTAKTLFNIPDSYDNFSYNINKRNDKTVFDLMWNDSKNKLGNVNVTIDADGKVLNYYSYKPYDGRRQKKLPTVSRSDARKIAEKFIQKVQPAAWSKLKYQENNFPMNINERSYYFYYVRVANGVPYPENGINMAVDAMTGDVQSFGYNWYDDVNFPDAGGAMGLAEAQAAYADKLGLKLLYKLNYDQNEQMPYLVYTSVYNNRFIDAETGEIVTSDNFYGYGSGGYMGARESKMAFDGGGNHNYNEQKTEALTPKEQEAVKNAADLIDQDKAEETARTTLNISSDFKLNYVSLYNSWRSRDDYIWNLDFGKEEKNGGDTRYYNVSVGVDARTGDIVNFYRSIPYDQNGRVKYTGEQSLKIAADFIKSMQPEKFKEVEQTTWNDPVIRPMAEEQRETYYTFTRKTNGIYFMENGFNIAVDNTTGTVINYNFTWYNKPLPPADKIITLDQAHKALFDTIGIQLQYISRYPAETYGKIMPPEETRKPEIKLVYTLKPEKPANIDAYTGKLLKYDGKPFEADGVTQYTDIKGNYAESQIKVLAEYGIALPGSQLKPNQNITQREFLYLLEKAVNPYVELPFETSKDDDAMYNLLIDAGIVKEGEKSPKSVLTRQDAVKFLVRALNYDKVAEIKGIFTLSFKDANKIKPDLYGYMAIAYGLKLIQGSNGYCNPTANLTRAQAFVMLYNYLNVQ